MTNPEKFTVRLATKDDQHLPYYSHSIMEAICMCPKWGIIRYIHKKYYQSTYRSLALEAGGAMHDVFAGMRLWQLLRVQELPDHFKFHGERLLGKVRFANCWEPRPGDDRNEALNFLFNILNTSGYYDDPDDKVRTIANMETSIIFFFDRMFSTFERNPVWVRGPATGDVGIECTFDIVINEEIRIIGTIDGISEQGDYVRPEENKTASRLDEAWRKSWQVKSQVTGYLMAARLLTERETQEETRIMGIKLKQTRSHEDMLDFLEYRSDDSIFSWLSTLYFVHQVVQDHKSKPLEAPQFTHSCNRFFRPCGFVDLCGAEPSDQQHIFDGMGDTDLSPSEKAIFERYQDA